MKITKFRVTMYKGIIDSGWVKVEPLTALVGKNESGKTSLLKALHKLNPYKTEPYEMTKEWPRGRRGERSKGQIACQASFQLTDREKSELAKLTEQEIFPDTIEVSRNYAGSLKIECGEVFSNERHSDDIDEAFDILPEVQNEFSTPFRNQVNECLTEARNLALVGQFDEFEELVEKHQELLNETISLLDSPEQIEINFINEYIAGLNELIKTLEPLPSIRSKVNEYIMNRLPTFIYMDDYRTFSGTAHLTEIKTRQDSNRLTEEDKTFLTILDLSSLDLENLVQLGQGSEDKIEERQYELDDGAATLTETISGRFQQRRYEVTYRSDGQHFFTFVKDDRDPALIKLEERSKGFQWFFSFDLMFMHESKGTFENCVILLDEPGLHLHPHAQKNLLQRLEEYAKGNTLLYTTHLPFMIDLNHPARIRILKETTDGIVVTTNFTDSPPEAKLVLQAALGMDASQSFLVSQRNLVVEGVDDYWVLTELSNLLRLDGSNGMPDDVLITVGNSASTAVHIAMFMIGQNFDVVILLDSDNAGREAKEKLVKNWLTQYTEAHTEPILLGEAVGVCGDFALEDLFPEDFILDIVKEVYKQQLAAADVDEITLQGEDILWQKINRFMKEKGIKINKGPIAKRLRNNLSEMKEVNELPDGTEEKAIKLFQEIRMAFGEQE